MGWGHKLPDLNNLSPGASCDIQHNQSRIITKYMIKVSVSINFQFTMQFTYQFLVYLSTKLFFFISSQRNVLRFPAFFSVKRVALAWWGATDTVKQKRGENARKSWMNHRRHNIFSRHSSGLSSSARTRNVEEFARVSRNRFCIEILHISLFTSIFQQHYVCAQFIDGNTLWVNQQQHVCHGRLTACEQM